MKTQQLKEFYESLSELNNSFTHYNFVWNQFNSDYLSIFEKNPDKFTNEQFSDNLFKRKHNIKLSLLENEHEKTNTTLTSGIFILIFSYFESYLKNNLSFANEIDSLILKYDDIFEEEKKDHTVLEKILNRLDIKLEKQYADSFDYLRLKRNRFIHSNAKNISGTANTFIKEQGKNLDKFWNEILPSNLQGIIFSDRNNFDLLDFNMIIDSINILRKIAEEVNSKTIVKLGRQKILNSQIIPEFIEKKFKKINGYKIERKISKFENYCKSFYGIELTENEIESYVSSLA